MVFFLSVFERMKDKKTQNYLLESFCVIIIEMGIFNILPKATKCRCKGY